MALNRAYIEKIQRQRNDLAVKKHENYASVVDPIAVNGIDGLITRIIDKAVRIASLKKNNKANINESLRETLGDLANYADYGVVMIDGQWPGVAKQVDPNAVPKKRKGRRKKNVVPAAAEINTDIK